MFARWGLSHEIPVQLTSIRAQKTVDCRMSRVSLLLLLSTVLATLNLLSPAGVAQVFWANRQAARWYAGNAVWGAGLNYGPVGPWGFGSTPAESYNRGMADLVRARGQAAESAARAAKDREIARAQYLENKSRWTEDFERRRRAALAERTEQQDQRRAQIDRSRASRRTSAQDMPVATELDPETGAIAWPEILQSDEYQASRERLDALFQLRAEQGADPQLTGEIIEAADEMRSLLRGHIGNYAPNDYIAADRLLRSLQSAGTAAT